MAPTTARIDPATVPLLRGRRPDARPSASARAGAEHRARARAEPEVHATTGAGTGASDGPRAGAAGQQPSTRLTTRPPPPRADRDRRVGLLFAVAAGSRIRSGLRRRITESSGLTRQQGVTAGRLVARPRRERASHRRTLRPGSILEDGWVAGRSSPSRTTPIQPRTWSCSLVAARAPRAGGGGPDDGTRTVDVLEPRRDAASVKVSSPAGPRAAPREVRRPPTDPRAWTMLTDGLVDLSVASFFASLLGLTRSRCHVPARPSSDSARSASERSTSPAWTVRTDSRTDPRRSVPQARGPTSVGPGRPALLSFCRSRPRWITNDSGGTFHHQVASTATWVARAAALLICAACAVAPRRCASAG